MLGVLVVSSCGSERLRCGGFCWDKCVCVGLDEVDLCVCVFVCLGRGGGGPYGGALVAREGGIS